MFRNQLFVENFSAVTRIRTWVIAATTQCTNHYTITACEHSKNNLSDISRQKPKCLCPYSLCSRPSREQNYILKFIPIVQDSGDTNDTKKTFLRFSARQITRSGVRTHADNRPLELKSNALTTRPSW